jgi:hypothetical protein
MPNSSRSLWEPFLGIVAKNGYLEAYDLKTAKNHDFHHSYALSPEGSKYYDDDDTLRFVKYYGDDEYTLEGSPALDPFNMGSKQIQIFAKYCIEAGASPNTPVTVADHALGTPYEGKNIGTLKDWVWQRRSGN